MVVAIMAGASGGVGGAGGGDAAGCEAPSKC